MQAILVDDLRKATCYSSDVDTSMGWVDVSSSSPADDIRDVRLNCTDIWVVHHFSIFLLPICVISLVNFCFSDKLFVMVLDMSCGSKMRKFMPMPLALSFRMEALPCIFLIVLLWCRHFFAVSVTCEHWYLLNALQIAAAWKPLMKRLGLWKSIRSLARLYDAGMGMVILIPIALFSWFPFVSTFQTRLMFNQAFSRGLEISLILAGNNPNTGIWRWSTTPRKVFLFCCAWGPDFVTSNGLSFRLTYWFGTLL